MLEDTFFMRTGLEKDQLDLVFAYQKLNENSDFLSMKKDYITLIHSYLIKVNILLILIILKKENN